jgi:hypothetical protein
MATRPGYIWSGTEWVSIGQEAVVAPVAYQASAPSTPATGDIWIDSDDDVPSVNSTLYYRWKKTAAGGETSFTGTDDNSLTLAYTAGYESVFINGVLQVRGSDYTATTGTSITGLTALTAGDIVMVESVMAYSVGDTYTQSVLDGKFSPITTTGGVLVSNTSFTTSASVIINNCFSSTYDNYKIFLMVSGLSVDGNLQLQLRTGVTTVSSNYETQLLDIYGTTVGAVRNPLATGFRIQSSSTSGFTGISASVDLINPFLSSRTFIMSSAYTGYTAVPTYINLVNGSNSNATSYESLVLSNAGGGTITGTIKVYGYK